MIYSDGTVVNLVAKNDDKMNVVNLSEITGDELKERNPNFKKGIVTIEIEEKFQDIETKTQIERELRENRQGMQNYWIMIFRGAISDTLVFSIGEASKPTKLDKYIFTVLPIDDYYCDIIEVYATLNYNLEYNYNKFLMEKDPPIGLTLSFNIESINTTSFKMTKYGHDIEIHLL